VTVQGVPAFSDPVGDPDGNPFAAIMGEKGERPEKAGPPDPEAPDEDEVQEIPVDSRHFPLFPAENAILFPFTVQGSQKIREGKAVKPA